MKHFLLLSFLLIAFSFVFQINAQNIVINEILIQPDTIDAVDSSELRTHQWIELYNAGTDTINLGCWTISNRDTLPLAKLPSWDMPPAAYLLVHFSTGMNDSILTDSLGHFYVGGDTSVFDTAMDECALYAGIADTSTIQDFISWVNDTSYTPGTAHQLAVDAGIWIQDFVFSWEDDTTSKLSPFLYPGSTIGRDSLSTDTNDPDDWAINGGADAFDLSGGQRNGAQFSQPLVIYNNTPIPGPLPKKKWTLMFYIFGSDNPIMRSAQYNISKELQRYGSTSNVNIVVQWILPTDNNFKTFRADRYYIYLNSFAARKGFIDQPRETVLTSGNANGGDPGQLRDFISWSQQRFPADHYGMFVLGHGNGWKGMFREWDLDHLKMDEMRAALSSTSGTPVQKLDVLYFYHCLMGQAEVAYQLEGKVDYMVGSEEVHRSHFPFSPFLHKMYTNIGTFTPKIFAEEAASAYDFYFTYKAKFDRRTISVIDVNRHAKVLTPLIDGMAKDLTAAVNDYRGHRDSTDNLQLLLKSIREASEEFSDSNFIDLRDFAIKIANHPDINPKYKTNARRIVSEMRVRIGGTSGTVVYNAAGSAHNEAYGLTIYFPRFQHKADSLPSCCKLKKKVRPKTCVRCKPRSPFNSPWRYRKGPPPTIKKYSFDPNDCKPPDIPCVNRFQDAKNHPIVPETSFRFASNTNWDEFLHRYYEPVADVGDDFVFAWVDEPILLNGKGSSDSDGIPTAYLWDFFGDVDEPGCNDANKDCIDGSGDDTNGSGPTTTVMYSAPGIYTLCLNVWDDHHLQSGHSGHKETDQDCMSVFILAGTDTITFDDDGGCGGDEVGSVIVDITGTAIPYTYSWNTGATTNHLTDVPIGEYTVTITNGNNIQYTIPVLVKDNDPIDVYGEIIQPTCENGADGKIFLEVAQTLNEIPTLYTYQWSNGETVQNPCYLSPGNYTVTVSDGNNCEATESFTLFEDPVCYGAISVDNFNNGQPDLPLNQMGGFISGTNSNGDLAKAEFIQVQRSGGIITGAFVDFGFANGFPFAPVFFQILEADSFGQPTPFVIGNASVRFSDIQFAMQFGQPLYVPFQTPVPTGNAFFVVVQMPQGGLVIGAGANSAKMTSDSLAIVTNSPGETDPSTAWTQDSLGGWSSYSAAYGLDIAHSITVEIDYPEPNCPKDGFEPNDEFLLASNLWAGILGWKDRVICPKGDVDYHKIDVDALGKALQVELLSPDADLTLELYDFNHRIARSATPGTGDESLSIPNIGLGTYYIKVFGEGAETNSSPYQLTANLISPPPPSTSGTKPNVALPVIKTDAPKPDIHIYPNPAKDWVQIDAVALGEKVESAVLLDVSGRRVPVPVSYDGFSAKLSSLDISSGTYFISIQTETNSFIKKLIIIK